MAESQDPRWLKWVAVSTTIFAVSAAIASVKSGGFSGRVGVLTTREANAWNFFQAKSLKQHIFEAQRDTFQLAQKANTAPAGQAFLAEKLAEYEREIARYEAERDEIKTQAEGYAKEQEALKGHQSQLGLAVMLLQIAIMMSSVSTLVKQQGLWLAGLAMGLGGLAALVAGLLL
jgi:hypothetical protein